MDNFTINSRENNNDLHIQLTGTFDDNSAYALKSICKSQYKTGGRLFIDLRSMTNLKPNQQLQFKQLLGELTLPPQKMYLKGEQALKIGYNGTRVLLMKSKKCACIKPCEVCSCKKRMQQKHTKLQQ